MIIHNNIRFESDDSTFLAKDSKMLKFIYSSWLRFFEVPICRIWRCDMQKQLHVNY